MKYLILLLAIYGLFEETWGHGMMLDPAGRSSRWRFDNTAPNNYNDNELFCGGYVTQYKANGGKCGICGDDYRAPTPRPNELGGEYGQGGIVKIYKNTNTIEIIFNITANHLGYTFVELCNLDEFGKESEDCFKYRLKFADGKDRFYVGKETGKFYAKVILPKGLNCKHCVFRWTYYAGNNWNLCKNSSYGDVGCGDQETFKSCADISIIQNVKGLRKVFIEELSPKFSEEDINVHMPSEVED